MSVATPQVWFPSLFVDLGVDPHVLELLDEELHVIHQLGDAVGREADTSLETVQ